MSVEATNKPADRLPRPWHELRDSGLLWLINRVVFHPRGWALAIHRDEDGTSPGWSLLGDGLEPWSMGDPPEKDRIKFGAKTEDELFALVQELLAPAFPVGENPQ